MVVNENGGELKEQASQAERAGAKGSGASSLPRPLIFSSLTRRSPCGPPTEGLEQARRVVSLRSTLWLVQFLIEYRNCISFASLRFVIDLEDSRHPLNQSDAKLEPIATWSLAFSRA